LRHGGSNKNTRTQEERKNTTQNLEIKRTQVKKTNKSYKKKKFLKAKHLKRYGEHIH